MKADLAMSFLPGVELVDCRKAVRHCNQAEQNCKLHTCAQQNIDLISIENLIPLRW
jgi:hypothetical protein